MDVFDQFDQYDPERRLWVCGRRSFIFLFGASALGAAPTNLRGACDDELPQEVLWLGGDSH